LRDSPALSAEWTHNVWTSNKTTNTAAKIPTRASVAEGIEKLMSSKSGLCDRAGFFSWMPSISGAGAEMLRLEGSRRNERAAGEDDGWKASMFPLAVAAVLVPRALV